MDHIEIGPTPTEEPCQQVGMPSYDGKIAKLECNAFKHQLERMFPDGEFGVTRNPHDFGTYYEVVAFFWNDGVEYPEDSVEFKTTKAAYDAEKYCPEYWDSEAKRELQENGAMA